MVGPLVWDAAKHGSIRGKDNLRAMFWAEVPDFQPRRSGRIRWIQEDPGPEELDSFIRPGRDPAYDAIFRIRDLAEPANKVGLPLSSSQ
jgi:hypothetical protein